MLIGLPVMGGSLLSERSHAMVLGAPREMVPCPLQYCDVQAVRADAELWAQRRRLLERHAGVGSAVILPEGAALHPFLLPTLRTPYPAGYQQSADEWQELVEASRRATGLRVALLQPPSPLRPATHDPLELVADRCLLADHPSIRIYGPCGPAAR